MKIKLNFKRKFINESKVKNLTHLLVGSKAVKVELATNEESRRKGLQSREHLEEDSGMFFMFDEPKYLSFWMENTYIPLSIAYLDENYKIIDIFDMKPLSKASTTSTKPAKFALEVNKGWFKKNNISTGTHIAIKK